MTKNWRAAYNALSRLGYTDEAIGELADCSRAVINKVRNGTWPYGHEPGYAGGERVIDAIDGAIKQGVLDHDPLDEPLETPNEP